jgi:hypothetical protein
MTDAHDKEYIIKRKRGFLDCIIDGVFFSPLEKAIGAGVDGVEYSIKKGFSGIETLGKKGTEFR